MAKPRFLAFFALSSLLDVVVFAATFTLVNECSYPVWPGLLSGAGTPQLPTTGILLNPGDSVPVSVTARWSGRIWGRTLCSQDNSEFTCVTGDCGSGDIQCSGSGATPPATLAEFTLDGAGGLDFYDVSLVDGFNLPMLVVPQGGTGNCSYAGCVTDINGACPSQLRVVDGNASSSANGAGGCVACKSACDAFGDPQYCCSGAYASPSTCKPSEYSRFFKSACPDAYSYAYDDATSTFTCAGSDYVITFCPSPSAGAKSSGGQINGAGGVTLVSSSGSHSSHYPLMNLIILISMLMSLAADFKP